MSARRATPRAGVFHACASLTLVILASTALAQVPPAEEPLLRAPEPAARPRRSSFDRTLLVDCAEHGAWTAPEGWTTHALDRGAVAIAPDGSAALVRAPARPRLRDDAAFAALVVAVVERLTGARPTLGPVEGIDRNRWRRERTVGGTVTVRGASLVVLGKATRTEAAWVAVRREPDTTARDAIDRAIAGWAMLVSHACQCGYDCDHPPRAAQ